VTASNGIVLKLALYTTRDHDCISNRIGSGIRTCPPMRMWLATFGALPTPSDDIARIIMLNNPASGPSSSGKTLSSFHLLLARPCRSALPARAVSFSGTFEDMPNASSNVRVCEGFGMTAIRDDAACTGAVVRKPPMKENRGRCGEVARQTLWGFDGCRD